jgi:hypothetical protein
MKGRSPGSPRGHTQGRLGHSLDRDSGYNSASDVRGLLLRNVQGDSGVNSARRPGFNPEFDLPSNPYRYSGRSLQDYPQGHLQSYLQDDSQRSLPDCGPISALSNLGQHLGRSGAGGQGQEVPAWCRE